MVPNTAAPSPFPASELPINPEVALAVSLLPAAALLMWLMPTQLFATFPTPFSFSASTTFLNPVKSKCIPSIKTHGGVFTCKTIRCHSQAQSYTGLAATGACQSQAADITLVPLRAVRDNGRLWRRKDEDTAGVRVAVST